MVKGQEVTIFEYPAVETLSPFILAAKYEVSSIIFLVLIVDLKIRECLTC